MDKKNLKALPEMRKILSALLVSFFFATAFTACSSSKEAQTSDQSAAADTTAQGVSDTSRTSASSNMGTAPIGELDSVVITTDTRVNPVLAARTGRLSTGATPVEKISDAGLGCEFFIPTAWKDSRREYKNLVNYYHDSRISVTVSVAKTMFDSLNFWSQIQESMTYGKNQIPRSDWRFDPATEARSKVAQSYIGRYQFGGKQYNTAFFRHGEYQFNMIIDHPIDGLKEGEADIINYMMANFVAGEPTVEIPKPVITSYEDPGMEPTATATETKKVTAKKETPKKTGKSAKKKKSTAQP